MADWMTQLSELVIPDGKVDGITEADKPTLEGKLLQLPAADRPLFFVGDHVNVIKRLRTLLPETRPGADPFSITVDAVGPESEGISGRLKLGIYSSRTATVDALLQQLQARIVCILTAPPRSGKTALCVLTAARARESSIFLEVYYVNCARASPVRTFETLFREKYGKAFDEICTTPTSSPSSNQGSQQAGSGASYGRKKLLIVDEAQTTYEAGTATELWQAIKEIAVVSPDGADVRSQKNLLILLAGSRGSNPTVAELSSTPHDFGADQRIPLRCDDPLRASLQFKTSETDEIFSRWCKVLRFDPEDLTVVGQLLAATSERHPGTFMHILDSLKEQLSPANYWDAPSEWQEKCCKFVASPYLLNSLTAIRSFPRPDRIGNNNVAANLVNLMLQSPGGTVDMSWLSQNYPALYEMAVLWGRSGQMLIENNQLLFISGLHMEYYRYHCVRMRYQSVQEMPPTLQLFLVKAIRGMKTSAFFHSLNKTRQGSVLEAQCHHELYRSISEMMASDAYLSPSVGTVYGLKAYVDLVLLPQKWALECLISGKAMKEHVDRFLPQGRYEPMLSRRCINAWAVIDLRGARDARPRISALRPNMYHVLFSADFTSAEIVQVGHKETVFLQP